MCIKGQSRTVIHENLKQLSPTPRNILTQSVTPNFLPLDLLSGNGQLSPQALECAFGQSAKAPVKLFLVIALSGGDFGNDRVGRDRRNGDGDWFAVAQSYVAVFVVVYVDVDIAGDCGRGGGNGDLVDGAVAAIPILPNQNDV